MNVPLTSTHLANPIDPWLAPRENIGGKSLMDHLFSRLDGMYPIRWKSAFPTPETIENWNETWAEAFDEEGIVPADIKSGLKACRSKYDWPPSCSEFIKACKPSVDSMVAYYEAVAGIAARAKGDIGKWSHPAIYWASVRMAFDLSSQTFSQVKGRWEQALSDQMDKGEWEAIPESMIALSAPGKGELYRLKAGAMLKELGASGILSSTGRDERRWAKKIIQREADGDKTVTSLQIRFACEAMAA